MSHGASVTFSCRTYVLPLFPFLFHEPGERRFFLFAPLPLVVVGVEVPRDVTVDLQSAKNAKESQR